MSEPELTNAQRYMLDEARRKDGVVILNWRTMRTAKVLAYKGLGVICMGVIFGQWGVHGNCFVLTEKGWLLVKEGKK